MRLADTLGDSVAALGYFARAFGRETEKADHDGSKRLDKREASPFHSGSPA